jgi:tetratricopeptide (TPR) repeat protein
VADIFVSYTSSDREWAFWIGQELTRLSHQPRIHEWEIQAGGDIPAWMEQRLQQAHRVLCVVSAEYLTKDYSGWERRSAQSAAASKRPNFMLPVFVEDCEAPVAMAHIKRCALFDLSEDDARARLEAYLAEARPRSGPMPFPGEAKTPKGRPAHPETVAFPGKKFALSNIPISVPLHFLGREDALAAVDAALKRHEARVAITTVHGLRGVGKTTLAAAYAERHRGDYRATWWVRAQTADSMRADLVSLGVRLGWAAVGEKEAPALEKVMERLRHEGEGLLIVYDNATQADALKPFLPKGGAARVLVTSNAPDWRGLAQPIELKLWPKETGADYLIARTGRGPERAEVEALSEALGGLPLAHEQAAAYCERLSVSFADYARRFEATPIRLLDAEKDAPLDYHDKLTVAKTFSLAIDEAAKLHPAAEPLITYAALLAPEPIPLFLFSEAREKFGEPLASHLADDGLDEAVAALRSFALVDRETIVDERDASIKTDTIRLHRLVRAVAARRRLDHASEVGRRVLIDAMASLYPSEVCDAPSAWPRARRLDALALDLVACSDPPPAGAEGAMAHLLTELGQFRRRPLAAFVAARPLFERALAIRETALGPEHSDTAESLSNLASLLQDHRDLTGARPLHERALAIKEEALGPGHPSTAVTLAELARLLQAQGDFRGARPLLERALTIFENALGIEHPWTAIALINLAHLIWEGTGYIAGARPLHERALTIFEKSEHPDIAMSLSNLAGLLRAEGDFVGARPLYERALAIREKALGPDHPDTGGYPQRPRSPASSPRRPRRRAAALRACAGHPREGARPRASLNRHEPQQPRRPASGPGRPRRRAVTLRAGAGDPREGARPRAPLDRR